MEVELLACSEEMMPETPEGEVPCPGNMSEIVRRRALSEAMRFENGAESGPFPAPDPRLSTPTVLASMLKVEETLHAQISPIMFTYTQDQVTPSMRCDTYCWLFEVTTTTILNHHTYYFIITRWCGVYVLGNFWDLLGRCTKCQ